MKNVGHYSNTQTLAAICAPAVLALLGSCGGSGGGPGETPDEPDPGEEIEAVCTGDSTPLDDPVLYLSNGDGVPPTELYLVDAENPEAGSIRVNSPLTPQQSLDSYALSPDNRCAVYISDERIAGRFELYSVDLAAPGVSARLNPPLSQDQDVKSFVISPDGSQVMYTSDQDNAGQTELFLVNLDQPGVSVQVNPDLVDQGDVSSEDIAFSPDGNQLLYVADQRTEGIFEIFLVNKAVPGVASVVNGPFEDYVNLATGLGFSPDGNWIGYMADPDIDDVRELFVVDVSDPGTSIKLNPPYGGETDLCSFEFRPDSLAVAYCADQDTEDKLELYTVSLDSPGISTRVNPPLVEGGEVRNNFRYSPDSDYLVYIADQDVAGIDELYRVQTASPGVADKLNDTLVDGGDVDLFEIRPDNTAVAYVADQDTNNVFELFQLKLEAPAGTPLKMNSPHKGIDLFPIEYSADSTRIFYIADEVIANRHQLYRVDVDNPGVSTRLNFLLVAGGQVFDFVIPR